MDTRKLNYFIVLCEEMNYRRAAERLFITQPTLSQQIKQLEKELNLQLFERAHNTIHLTKEGQMLLTKSYKLIQQLNVLKSELAQYQDAAKREISIGVTGTNLILKPMQAFAIENPDITIRIREHSLTTIRRLIVEGEIDFGICYYSGDHDDQIVRRFLSTDAFVCVTPQSHPLSQQKVATVDDLQKYPLILAQAGLAISNSLQHYEALTNIKLHPQYQMPNYNACLSLVKRNLGISILPSSFVSSFTDDDFASIALGDFEENLNIALLNKRDHAFTLKEQELIASIYDFLNKS